MICYVMLCCIMVRLGGENRVQRPPSVFITIATSLTTVSITVSITISASIDTNSNIINIVWVLRPVLVAVLLSTRLVLS